MRHALLFIALVFTVAPRAQVYEPARGSAERAAILDALRSAVRTMDYAPVRGSFEFAQVRLRSSSTWAFVDATPQRPGGGATRHCEAEGEEAGDGDPNVIALLYKRGSRWEVVESYSCATDVGYMGWAAQYGAPVALDDQFIHYARTIRPPRFPASARVARTSDGFVALRDTPSASRGQRLATMPGGSTVRVLSCQGVPARVGGVGGQWCRVSFGGQTGWAFSPYLEIH